MAHSGVKRFVGSVAFVTESGVSAVAKELKSVAKASTFFVGIRNDITSVQALRRLLQIGVRVFAVDTASRIKIFHPKVFLVKGEKDALAIIGSANMTFNGLHNNIEASAFLTLDLKDTQDKSFIESSLKLLDQMPIRFPDHVFKVKDMAHVDKLFDEGRLVDEDVVVAPAVTSSVRRGDRDRLAPMKLSHHTPPDRKRRMVQAKSSAATTTPMPTPAASVAAPAPTVGIPQFVRIWESRELKERDLNIPSGKRTNATGSMLWKKGATQGIDQRHFFRDKAFANLNWQKDPAKPHIERTEANFQLVVKGLNCGIFKLKLSHNTVTTSASYRQSNSMTQVHWGSALGFIAKRDLLGRVMFLYRKNGNPPEFMIEVD